MPYVEIIDDSDDDDEYCCTCGYKREDYLEDRLIWMGTGKRRVLVRNPNFVYHTCKYPSRTWITFWNCIREFGEGIKG